MDAESCSMDISAVVEDWAKATSASAQKNSDFDSAEDSLAVKDMIFSIADAGSLEVESRR